MDYTRTARLVAYEANGANSTAPLYHGCLDSLSRSLPYCDTSLSYEARARDLLGRLSINEKVNLLSGHTAPYCGATTKSVPSVGLPAWKWLTETNTMAAGCATASGMTRCSTVFVGPLGVAASFNRSAWWLKGDVVSTQVFLDDIHDMGRIQPIYDSYFPGRKPALTLVQQIPSGSRQQRPSGHWPAIEQMVLVAVRR